MFSGRAQAFGFLEHLAVEVLADAVDRQRADRDREAAQDHERQQRRDPRQTDPDRQAVEGAETRAPAAPRRREAFRPGGRSRLP